MPLPATQTTAVTWRKTTTLPREVVAAFLDRPDEGIRRPLAQFSPDEWIGNYGWLEKSGLELYLFARIKALSMEESLPAAELARMERHLAENRIRTAKLFEEFTRINDALQLQRLNYCNVKGIALVPTACPDPTLRRQLNFDLILSATDFASCCAILGQLGYVAHSTSEHFCEFRAVTGETASTIDNFTAQPSIGVYLVSPHSTGVERAPYMMLMRRHTQTWNRYTFPAPTHSDHFVAQAIRMLGQAGFEWNRLSFLLEFSRSVEYWMRDETFWYEVIDRAREHPLRPVAIGTATRLAAEIFGTSIPLPLREWATRKIDACVHAWSEQYGWDSLLTHFPGTSLSKLLQSSVDS